MFLLETLHVKSTRFFFSVDRLTYTRKKSKILEPLLQKGGSKKGGSNISIELYLIFVRNGSYIHTYIIVLKRNYTSTNNYFVCNSEFKIEVLTPLLNIF